MDTYQIVWSDALHVGNPLIDEQHRKLVELIGAISEQETTRDPATLNAALEYAGKHFADEEELMRNAEYPALAQHQGEHKRLTRTLLAYNKRFQAGETDLYAFKNFMFTWVRDHIMDEDRKIGLHLRSRAPR